MLALCLSSTVSQSCMAVDPSIVQNGSLLQRFTNMVHHDTTAGRTNDVLHRMSKLAF